MQSKLIETLAETFPAIIVRSKVGTLTGGLITPKTLSNHDALRKGPSESNVLYGKRVYSKKAFLEWLKKACRIVRSQTMNNHVEQQTDLCFEADYLSLDKPEYGRWRSYPIKLDSLPSALVENSDQEPLDFIVKLLRERPNIVLLSFTKLEDDRFTFTSELSLEIITAARQAGLTHIRAYHVEPPFTVKDVYRSMWNKIFSLDCFTTDLDLTSQPN